MTRFCHFALMALALTILAATAAQAQISNKAFSFDGANGLGMSDAGKQAIINQKLIGATPDVLLRDSSGQLLGVEKGPGGVPIVTAPGGEILPSYHGPSWKGANPELAAGVFNPYFVMRQRARASLALTSSQTVDVWTDTVQMGGPSGYGSSVDQWVAMAYYLGPRL